MFSRIHNSAFRGRLLGAGRTLDLGGQIDGRLNALMTAFGLHEDWLNVSYDLEKATSKVIPMDTREIVDDLLRLNADERKVVLQFVKRLTRQPGSHRRRAAR